MYVSEIEFGRFRHRILGTSEPIETSVNRSHHGTDADVVKSVRTYAMDGQA